MVVNTAAATGCWLTAIAKPVGMRKRPSTPQRAGNVSKAGSIANFMIDAHGSTKATAIGYDGATVAHVAARRERQDRRSRENDGRGGARPCGGEPERREGSSRDECARRTDERRQPIRQAGPETSRTTKGPPGSIHEQRQAIERVH